jgi:hypothetical protein
VYARGDTAARDTGLLLAAFKNADQANNFTKTHSDEMEIEMRADIKAEVERHLLCTTGRPVRAEAEKEQIIFWAQKGEGDDIKMQRISPNSEARQEIRTHVNDLFCRTYPEYSVRKALMDRARTQSARGTMSYRVTSIKTGQTHESLVRRLKIETGLLYSLPQNECKVCDERVGDGSLGELGMIGRSMLRG